MDKAIVHRRIDLALEMLKNGSISTINERAALWAATKSLMSEVVLYLSSKAALEEYSASGNFMQDYVVGVAEEALGEAAYYYGFGDYTDMKIGERKDIVIGAFNKLKMFTPRN